MDTEVITERVEANQTLVETIMNWQMRLNVRRKTERWKGRGIKKDYVIQLRWSMVAATGMIARGWKKEESLNVKLSKDLKSTWRRRRSSCWWYLLTRNSATALSPQILKVWNMVKVEWLKQIKYQWQFSWITRTLQMQIYMLP